MPVRAQFLHSGQPGWLTKTDAANPYILTDLSSVEFNPMKKRIPVYGDSNSWGLLDDGLNQHFDDRWPVVMSRQLGSHWEFTNDLKARFSSSAHDIVASLIALGELIQQVPCGRRALREGQI